MNAGIPSTRTARLSVIEQLLGQYVVKSQQQLVSLLAEEGIQVTQATLSRDLDDLRASKVRTQEGDFAYAVPTQSPLEKVMLDEITREQDRRNSAAHVAGVGAGAGAGTRASQHVDIFTPVARRHTQLAKVIGSLITKVVCAQNLVVIHTPPGAAQYVASAIDKYPIDHVAGTIAGDDTVMMITTDNAAAQEKMDWLMSMVGAER
ncbi:arginine repressor [Alloscardovia macacae]|uniref:Arginine repressor n=1 Tax=Alloscardovia macacae TaxID=1160091 RepID=A0A1Y2SVW3_9BIFI|nr:arginine repressor [Alloscardovia macacae]OTA26185.1 arginine repressor [Alloscardovia macacae]OTA29964.1 arginine repressor [Alloscardovia macacae]